jgi:ubiquinone/menaquinone biosynthesis C-methylase UbiE
MTDWARFDPVAPAIWSSIPVKNRGAPYDRMEAGYDALVGNGIYNRLIWGCAKSNYRRAATDFLAKVPDGPLIDFGCGSCVFTANAYQGHEERLTLFDRSLGMLSRAAQRLPTGRYLQGDALEPPFEDAYFSGAMSWGMLHIFGTASSYLAQLARIVKPGAPVAISTLVHTKPRIGNVMLNMLHRNKEAAQPEGSEVVMAAVATYFDLESSEQCGNMLFLTGRKRNR